MRKIIRQVRTELKLLPLMFGKLLGGIAGRIGLTAAVVIMTRKPGPPSEVIMPWILLGCAGIGVFCLSART